MEAVQQPYRGPVHGTINSATGEIHARLLSKPGEPRWDAIDEHLAQIARRRALRGL